jgi:hypothetical protein
MRSRIYGVILILLVAVSMRSTQTVLAANGCVTTVSYQFPSDQKKPWYTITADKPYPKKPVVKQQLEELAAHGDLSKPPDAYNAKFKADVTLNPGTAKWNHSYTTREWDYDSPFCTVASWCPGKWKDVSHCDPESATVYRSIKEMKVFLIPSLDTLDWYWNWEQSPTVMFAYPDFWIPVTLEPDGNPIWLPEGYQGLHFYYSIPLRDAGHHLPTALPQRPILDEVINPKDAEIYSGKENQINTVIPLCHFDSNGIFTPPYEPKYNVITDIPLSPYYCNLTGENVIGSNHQIQWLQLSISEYDFDIPGTFYIGVATEISRAKLPDSPYLTVENQPRTEPVKTNPYYFEPSNITDETYKSTIFTVWMIVSTPCWTGDGGCDMESPQKK